MFFSCGHLKEVSLPSTLKKIGKNAFLRCGNLKTVWVEYGCSAHVERHVDSHVEVKWK